MNEKALAGRFVDAAGRDEQPATDISFNGLLALSTSRLSGRCGGREWFY